MRIDEAYIIYSQLNPHAAKCGVNRSLAALVRNS